MSYQLLPIDRGTDFFITGVGSGYVQKYVVPLSGPVSITIQTDTFTGINHFIGTDDFGVVVNTQAFNNSFIVNDSLGAYTFDGVDGVNGNSKDTLNYAGLTNNSSINVTVTGYGAHGSMNGTVVKTSDLGMSTDTFLNMGVIQGVTTGNNTFIGNTGNDSFTGGNGNDIFMGGAGNDVLNGGGGTDTALYTNATSGLIVNLNVSSLQNVGGGQGSDTLISIENLTGGSFGDFLIGNAANNVLIGNGGADVIIGGAGNDNLVGGDITGVGSAFLDGGINNDILMPGKNLSSGNYTLTGGSGIDTLSYQNIDAGVTLDLGILGIAQNTIGAGSESLGDLFEVLQGSNFDDHLSFTNVATTGGPGVSKLSNISSETIKGMDGNDTITLTGTATGVGGLVGNEATISDQTSAQVTLALNTLDAGTGTGGQGIALIGTATGGNATDTFGNHALNGFTAISALVDIHDNVLSSESTVTSDTLMIQAFAFGGNAGATPWDDSNNVTTGGNVADGLGSKAISAQSLVDNNDLSGGIAGAFLLIDAEATGGNAGPNHSLYPNQALNDGVAISAQVTVNNNHMDGNSMINNDTLLITATATGGNVDSGGFTANVSGFITTAGGTATSAQVIVDGNVLTEHGTADALLEIQAMAIGGGGYYYGNYAFAGKAISADTQVNNNVLMGSVGNDTLVINAAANGGSYVANSANHAEPGAIAIDTSLHISGNTLDGGAGNDSLALLISAVPGGSNDSGGGTETLVDVTAQNNHLMGGNGNDVLNFDNSALLTPGNGNILDGGNGFDVLTQVVAGATLDLTPVGVAGGVLQNIEEITFQTLGATTLILDGTSVDNLNTSHELFVRGDSGSTVTTQVAGGIAGNWTFVGITSGPAAGNPLVGDAAADFYHYTQVVGADTVNLYVDTTMTVL